MLLTVFILCLGISGSISWPDRDDYYSSWLREHFGSDRPEDYSDQDSFEDVLEDFNHRRNDIDPTENYDGEPHTGQTYTNEKDDELRNILNSVLSLYLETVYYGRPNLDTGNDLLIHMKRYFNTATSQDELDTNIFKKMILLEEHLDEYKRVSVRNRNIDDKNLRSEEDFPKLETPECRAALDKIEAAAYNVYKAKYPNCVPENIQQQKSTISKATVESFDLSNPPNQYTNIEKLPTAEAKKPKAENKKNVEGVLSLLQNYRPGRMITLPAKSKHVCHTCHSSYYMPEVNSGTEIKSTKNAFFKDHANNVNINAIEGSSSPEFEYHDSPANLSPSVSSTDTSKNHLSFNQKHYTTENKKLKKNNADEYKSQVTMEGFELLNNDKVKDAAEPVTAESGVPSGESPDISTKHKQVLIDLSQNIDHDKKYQFQSLKTDATKRKFYFPLPVTIKKEKIVRFPSQNKDKPRTTVPLGPKYDDIEGDSKHRDTEEDNLKIVPLNIDEMDTQQTYTPILGPDTQMQQNDSEDKKPSVEIDTNKKPDHYINNNHAKLPLDSKDSEEIHDINSFKPNSKIKPSSEYGMPEDLDLQNLIGNIMLKKPNSTESDINYVPDSKVYSLSSETSESQNKPITFSNSATSTVRQCTYCNSKKNQSIKKYINTYPGSKETLPIGAQSSNVLTESSNSVQTTQSFLKTFINKINTIPGQKEITPTMQNSDNMKYSDLLNFNSQVTEIHKKQNNQEDLAHKEKYYEFLEPVNRTVTSPESDPVTILVDTFQKICEHPEYKPSLVSIIRRLIFNSQSNIQQKYMTTINTTPQEASTTYPSATTTTSIQIKTEESQQNSHISNSETSSKTYIATQTNDKEASSHMASNETENLNINEIREKNIFQNYLKNEFNFGSSKYMPDAIEITYLIRKPITFANYYVKFRVPYNIFTENVKSLLSRKTRRSSNTLFEKLKTVTNITEVSPDLRNIDKNELLKTIAEDGIYVKAKAIKYPDNLSTPTDISVSMAEFDNAINGLDKLINAEESTEQPDNNKTFNHSTASSDIESPTTTFNYGYDLNLKQEEVSGNAEVQNNVQVIKNPDIEAPLPYEISTNGSSFDNRTTGLNLIQKSIHYDNVTNPILKENYTDNGLEAVTSKLEPDAVTQLNMLNLENNVTTVTPLVSNSTR